MAMKRGGGVKGKKKAVKKRGGGMMKMMGGGAIKPKKKMAMGMMGGGSPKKKMAGGGSAKKKMAKGGLSAFIKRRLPKPMTGRDAAAKKAMGKTKAFATARGRFKQGKGNPAGKDMSRKGALLGLMKSLSGAGTRKRMSDAGRRAAVAAMAKARKAKKNTKGR